MDNFLFRHFSTKKEAILKDFHRKKCNLSTNICFFEKMKKVIHNFVYNFFVKLLKNMQKKKDESVYFRPFVYVVVFSCLDL